MPSLTLELARERSGGCFWPLSGYDASQRKGPRLTTTYTLHRAFDRMPRHRHGEAYVALVLAGSYVEAGDRGRLRIEAGQAVFHDRFESHRNEFFGHGAQGLNLPVPRGGHFANETDSQLVVDDLRRFFGIQTK